MNLPESAMEEQPQKQKPVLSAFEANLSFQEKFQSLDEPITTEHTVIADKLPSGTEIIIEIPPVLSRADSTHNSDNRIKTPLLNIESQVHQQCKGINPGENEYHNFKDGTGDFCFFIHIRRPGLFSLTLNCMFDGLSAASDQLWQDRLNQWNKKSLSVNGQRIELKTPDVAFSQLIRYFFNSNLCKFWLKDLDEKITQATIGDLGNLNLKTPSSVTSRELLASLPNTSLALPASLESLIQNMGLFRSDVLKGESNENALPLNEKEDGWYLNAIFGMTANLIIEPLTIFDQFEIGDKHQITAVEKIYAINTNYRSRADVSAHSGQETIMANDELALDRIKSETWLGDGNAQTDSLIYELRRISEIVDTVVKILGKIPTKSKWLSIIKQAINLLSQLKKSEVQIENELLKKPWQTYAVLPPSFEYAYQQALQATSHVATWTSEINYANLVSITASDGATTVTRDATKRGQATIFADNAALAIQQLVKQAVKKNSKDLGKWLDETLHTADDRSVQDAVISLQNNVSPQEFENFVKSVKESLANYRPVLKSEASGYKKISPVRSALTGV